MFNLDAYVQEQYYHSLYKEIGTIEHDNKLKTKNESKAKNAKIERTKQFHALIKDYLIAEGYS